MRETGGRFASDRRGGVAVLLALALVPLAGMAGAAVDYSRASHLRSSLQQAADAAALIAAKGNDPFGHRKQAAMAALAHQLRAQPGLAYKAHVKHEMDNGRETAVSVTLEAAVPTSLLGVIGIKSIDVSVLAKATSGRNESFDVAFVLDTTGSMTGARLTSLKSATTALIDDFMARRSDPDQVRVSVVPFGQYVNVGMANRSQPWISVPGDYQAPTSQSCQMVREVVSQDCRQVWQPAQPAQPRTCYNDGAPYDCSTPAQPGRNVDQCTPVHGPNSVQQCSTTGGEWVRWHGCVGSRNAPDNVRDANYSVRVPGLMNTGCGSPLLEPTSDLTLAKSRINALTTAGETYIPAGLIWGWRALSTQTPIAAREGGAGAPVARHMVLVTDGQNTRSPTYPRHDGSNAADANAIMRTTCENMAADTTTGIRLHTIAFEVTDPTVKKLLQDCSTMNGGAFYDAANASQLQDAMRAIGGQISRLRITS